MQKNFKCPKCTIKKPKRGNCPTCKIMLEELCASCAKPKSKCDC